MVDEGETSSIPGKTNAGPVSVGSELEEAVVFSLFFLRAASCQKWRESGGKDSMYIIIYIYGTVSS